MKQFLFPITLLVTLACQGAADDGYEKFSQSTQPQTPKDWPVSVAACKMPYQMATKKDRWGYYTCIVADPTLLTDELPKDFAHEILKKIDENVTPESFGNACFDAHNEHLSSETLKSGISSVHLALILGISRSTGYIGISWQPRTTGPAWLNLTGKPLFGLQKDPSTKKKFLHEFISQPSESNDIKMLKLRGEHAAAKELVDERVQNAFASFDIVIATKGVEEPASCKVCTIL